MNLKFYFILLPYIFILLFYIGCITLIYKYELVLNHLLHEKMIQARIKWFREGYNPMELIFNY